MRKFVRPIITVGLGLVLALLSAALTYSAPPPMQGNLAAAAFFLQPTTTPQPQDLSEIGSTDGIIVMGFIIALIIIIPILLQRKSWIETR
jgi:predicted membrane protein